MKPDSSKPKIKIHNDSTSFPPFVSPKCSKASSYECLIPSDGTSQNKTHNVRGSFPVEATNASSCLSRLAYLAQATSQLPFGDSQLLHFDSADSHTEIPHDEHQIQNEHHQMRLPALEDPSETKKTLAGEVIIDGESCRHVLRSGCNWSKTAVPDEHLWLRSSDPGESCYVSEKLCCRTGPRMKCSSCRIICHFGCISKLLENDKFFCKPTFSEMEQLTCSENMSSSHHWVLRRNLKGRCSYCSKSFISKLSFSYKDVIAMTCSWCKAAYHYKESCFSSDIANQQCSFGSDAEIIVPPTWIVKLPPRGSFKSNSKKSTKSRKSTPRLFVVRPVANASVKPLIVFLNPKSGGNQGEKIMGKLQWLLNPRQVFDLTKGGPRAGLELFKRIPNLRILACGGDGTVGWILSVLDQMKVSPAPSIAVLPLGTGNDLSRALGWGGGYTDEPISKILRNINMGECQLLDRWRAEVVPNPDAEICEPGNDNLPLNVVNNYFSLGVDAQIALQFHEAREAHPERFNSRLRNKMFYGQAGGKDLLQRKWKDLSERVTISCDGTDITPKLKEHKVHSILFLNIPSYGGGTRPWGGPTQSTSDGLIEVVGLTTYQLPLLHAGATGYSLAQCKSAKIVTGCTIPMQVDGEACRVNPSIITISHLNCARMIAKRSGRQCVTPECRNEETVLDVFRISLADYDQFHNDSEQLVKYAVPLGKITLVEDSDLEQTRKYIERLVEESENRISLGSWCFIDSCSEKKFFRIDPFQEQLHFATDICSQDLYLLDMSAEESSSCATQNCPSVPMLQVPKASEHDPSHTVSSECSSTISQLTGAEAGIDPHCLSDQHLADHLLEHSCNKIIEAARNGDLVKVKGMCEAGISLLSINEQGTTSLHVAAEEGHKEVVQYLLVQAPASLIDMCDTINGRTALHRAAIRCQSEICSMLIAAGASLTLRDGEQCTAKDLAINNHHPHLAAYLAAQEKFEYIGDDGSDPVASRQLDLV